MAHVRPQKSKISPLGLTTKRGREQPGWLQTSDARAGRGVLSAQLGDLGELHGLLAELASADIAKAEPVFDG
jgi:hypothetical protein